MAENREKIKNQARILIEQADQGPSKQYEGNHVYVWWNKDYSGEWRLHHTYPEDLKFRLEIRKAGIMDNEVLYGNKFVKYTYFNYNDRQLKGLSMRVNKYSLTPKGGEEVENRKLCEKEMEKRGLNKDLTQRTPSRF